MKEIYIYISKEAFMIYESFCLVMNRFPACNKLQTRIVCKINFIRASYKRKNFVAQNNEPLRLFVEVKFIHRIFGRRISRSYLGFKKMQDDNTILINSKIAKRNAEDLSQSFW
jgi:hypothetical protein